VVAFARQQRLRCGDRDLHQQLSSGIIEGLTAIQEKAERQSMIVAAEVDLAPKAAA
jgi:hypothetical protein